jgi:hypothetical protein
LKEMPDFGQVHRFPLPCLLPRTEDFFTPI